ncbi:MAG: hypothetical protein ACOYXR_00735 [Nitrospirota bacterium]
MSVTPPVSEIRWSESGLESLQRAPIFLRGMVKKLAEKKARELGIGVITAEQLAEWKNASMGGMGGEAGLKEAADQIAKGQLPWTQAAKQRLATAPAFMQDMVRRIAEDVARERGHMEVNVELLEKVEQLGVGQDADPQSALSWTEGALAKLAKKVEGTPPMATEFVIQMLKADAEDLARTLGVTEMTEEALTRVWETPQSDVRWSEEAWARLQTSPDFVRSGIKKAAERRARKAGAGVITSDLLTKFRNEAMMKAVMRIRKLGYTELTFDAFDKAKQEVKRLQGNEQADSRLDEIRAYMTKKPHVGVLGEELMTRFRKYLKGEGDLKSDA